MVQLKQNHDSFRDDRPINDNALIKGTPLERDKEKKPVKSKPKLPKRKWKKDKYQLFYLVHFLLLLLFLLAGYVTSTGSLVGAVIPYGSVVYIMYRTGGSLSGKGLEYTIWNLSVLTSTYVNAKMPNLRGFKTHLIWTGGIVSILMSLISPWFFLMGQLIFMMGLVFAFADKDEDNIAEKSRMISVVFLIIGTIGLFVSPGYALAVLFLSLCYHHLFEQWDEYEFVLNEENEA